MYLCVKATDIVMSKIVENKFTLYCRLHVIIEIIQFVKCPGAKLIDDL